MKRVLRPLALFLIFLLVFSFSGIPSLSLASPEDESHSPGEGNSGLQVDYSTGQAGQTGMGGNITNLAPGGAALPNAAEEPVGDISPLSSGTVYGKVTDASTGTGIKDVWISVNDDDNWYSIYTDESGYYSLIVPVGANYTVKAHGNNRGYSNKYYDGINVEEGAEFELNFALEALTLGTISGTVTDKETGKGLVGVWVGVYNEDNSFYTHTDADGGYSLQVGVGTGYTIHVTGKDIGYTNALIYNIRINENDELVHNFVLEEFLYGTISGRVTDAATETGIAGVQVSVYNEEYNFYTQTDANGDYSLQVGVGTGYTLTVWGEDIGYTNARIYNVEVNENDELVHNFTLDELLYGTISGKVTDAATGTGLNGIQVVVDNWDNWQSTYTDAQGNYMLDVIVGTNYEIRVRGQDAGYSNTSLYNIQVNENDELVYNFTLDELLHGTISGRVTDAATETGIAGVQVSVYNEEYHFYTWTDANGDYSLQVGVGTGYTIHVLGEDLGYANATVYEVQVRENEALENNFPLARLNATISGRVTDAATGNGLDDVQVSVYNEEYRFYTWTDANGDYSLRVAAGSDYTISVQGGGFGYANTFMHIAHVRENDELEKNFALVVPNATISGRVTDAATGNGLDDVQVSVYNEEYQFHTWTDTNGDYSLPVVGGCSYTIRVWGEELGYVKASVSGIQVGANEELELNFPLKKQLHVTITGRVTDAANSEGIGGILVEIYGGGELQSTYTDEQGSYTLKVIAGTDYMILVSGQEMGYSDASHLVSRLGEEETLVCDFALAKLTAAISGRVIDAATRAGIPGVPVSISNEDYFFYTETDANGDYFLGLAEGTGYTIEVQGQDTGYTNIFLCGVEVEQGAALVHDFELDELNFGTLFGRVTDADSGKGISGFLVSVYDGKGYYFLTWTDPDGYYTLQVAEGKDYTVATGSWSDGYEIDYAYGVEVVAGRTLQKDFRLERLEKVVRRAVAAAEALTAAPFPDTGTVQQVMAAYAAWDEAAARIYYLEDGAAKAGLQARLDAVRQVIDDRAAALASGAENALAAAEAITADLFPEQGTAEEVAAAYKSIEGYLEFISTFVEDLLSRLGEVLQRITERYRALLLETGQTLQMTWNESTGKHEAQLNFADGTVRIFVSSVEPIEGVELAVLKAGATMAPDTPANLTPAGIYLDIEILEGSLEGVEARIEVDYDPAKVDPEKLRLYRWERLPDQGVDTENCFIWAELNGGFSRFGVFEFNFIFGDVSEDGLINVGDAILLLKHLVGKITLTEDQLTAADVSGDATVNVVDAVLIMRHAAGLIHEFPTRQ